jgi:hypothetical protein
MEALAHSRPLREGREGRKERNGAADAFTGALGELAHVGLEFAGRIHDPSRTRVSLPQAELHGNRVARPCGDGDLEWRLLARPGRLGRRNKSSAIWGKPAVVPTYSQTAATAAPEVPRPAPNAEPFYAYPRIESSKRKNRRVKVCVARVPSDRNTQGSISRNWLSASGTVRGPSHGSKRSGASCFTRRTPKYKSSMTLSVPEERDPACPNAPPVTASLAPFLSTRP